MAFDFKKEFKEFYLPPREPALVEVPPMSFVAVRGAGDPNAEGGEYQAALEMLYGITFTVKMSYKSGFEIAGFYEYALPPLEGLWFQEGVDGVDYSRKADFNWISMIRLPEFVTGEVFESARKLASQKKGKDFSKAEYFTYDEGLCVQCMHLGPYDDEPATVAAMDEYAAAQGCALDFSPKRLHHEIYLNDPRRAAADKLRTVIRHPVRRA